MSDAMIERVGDTAGMAQFVLDGLADVEQEFYADLVGRVAARAGIALDDVRRAAAVRRVGETGIDLRGGSVEDAVLRVLTDSGREGPWAPHLDAFLAGRALWLAADRRRAVLRHLDGLPLAPGAGMEQTIARAVADVATGAGTDPVALTRPSARPTAWDFRVDLFEDAASQIVLADNVRAAGALMWCYDIGERLGVYRLTDALVYRWWTGLVDFADQGLTSELYRYYKLREDRPTEQERFLLYRRILAVGGAEVGPRVPVNEDFPQLWRSLMEEVATYIERAESSYRERVNRQGVEQAVRELQYNLTERMAGMALTQVTEMYNQLRQTDRASGALGGLDVLAHPEVVAQLSSGRRRDEWSVIERLAKEEFSTAPNVSALRTSAVEAYRVVDYLADFTPGRVDEQRFEDFIASAKSWILAQDVAGDGLLVPQDAAEDPDDPGTVDELDDEAWDEA